MNFGEWLDRLPGMVGERNLVLLPIARAAIKEHISDMEIVELIYAHSGNPPLTRGEIVRALEKARATSVDIDWGRIDSLAKTRELMKAASYSEEDKGNVPRLISEGRKWMKSDWDGNGNVFSHFSKAFASPPFKASPLEEAAYQAKVFCGSLWDTWEDSQEDGYVFLTNDNYAPRTRAHLFHPRDLVFAINDWVDFARRHGVRSYAPIGECIPQFVCANLFTGEEGLTEDGKPSFVCKSTIAHRRVALLEFDHLEKDDQIAFWVGFLLENPNSVYSLVASGRRSIHGLVNVGEAEGADPALAEATWRDTWKEIKRLYASNDNEAYCCDTACKDATRLTRMPGALRIGGKADGARQELLYVDPNAYIND